jgi:hypothetical protein
LAFKAQDKSTDGLLSQEEFCRFYKVADLKWEPQIKKSGFEKRYDEEVNVEEHTAPPNILILGQDSTSRLNFKRRTTKTVGILESLGAVEMLGYTRGKVTN